MQKTYKRQITQCMHNMPSCGKHRLTAHIDPRRLRGAPRNSQVTIRRSLHRAV